MAADDFGSLDRRLRRLEDDRAIRDLKARYLRACDMKDVEALRATLAEKAVVAFEGFPIFTDRESFIAVYQKFGCAPGIYDIHHGGNGVVEFDGEGRARGKWSLVFHNVNLGARTLSQFGVEYDDVYVRQEGRWRIAETRSRRKSVLIETVDADGRTMVTTMGETDAAFGEKT